ncbi:hypothetical protein TNCV_463311 [Trichonephila clavipes]|nr:hypothetical protein TNCV_463311 [Trichonephila clavipes]
MLWGRQVAGRNYPPTNKNTLIRALTEEWDKLHQQLLDNVFAKYEQWLPKAFNVIVITVAHTGVSQGFYDPTIIEACKRYLAHIVWRGSYSESPPPSYLASQISRRRSDNLDPIFRHH